MNAQRSSSYQHGRNASAAGTTSLAGTHSVTVTPAGRERAARQ
ncbi:hypothetical protein ACN9MH_27640 [Paenibacillus silvae]